jgi:hypothetical protein
VDLVVHAAGPFQREEKCTVLEAAITTKVPKCLYLLISVDQNFTIKNIITYKLLVLTKPILYS